MNKEKKLPCRMHTATLEKVNIILIQERFKKAQINHPQILITSADLDQDFALNMIQCPRKTSEEMLNERLSHRGVK